MSDEILERPPLTFRVNEDKTIKMVYGLEMDLRRLLPDPQSALQLVRHDIFVQDYIIRRCLTDSRKMVLEEDELISLEEVELDPDQVDDLLMWVVSHVLYFFVKRMTGLAKVGSQFQQALPTPTTAGSEA